MPVHLPARRDLKGRDLVDKNSSPPPLESFLCSYCFNRIKKGKAFGWKIFFLFDAQSFFFVVVVFLCCCCFFFAVNMRVLGRVFFMSDVCLRDISELTQQRR